MNYKKILNSLGWNNKKTTNHSYYPEERKPMNHKPILVQTETHIQIGSLKVQLHHDEAWRTTYRNF